jgi:hypothetical protein
VIDVKNGLLTLNINEEQVQFNAKKIKHILVTMNCIAGMKF